MKKKTTYFHLLVSIRAASEEPVASSLTPSARETCKANAYAKSLKTSTYRTTFPTDATTYIVINYLVQAPELIAKYLFPSKPLLPTVHVWVTLEFGARGIATADQPVGLNIETYEPESSKGVYVEGSTPSIEPSGNVTSICTLSPTLTFPMKYLICVKCSLVRADTVLLQGLRPVQQQGESYHPNNAY